MLTIIRKVAADCSKAARTGPTLAVRHGLRFDPPKLGARQGGCVAGFVGGELVVGHGRRIAPADPASANRIGDHCMARTQQKKGKKAAAVEGRRVAARVTERERMEALWQEARQLATDGKDDGRALTVLAKARRLAEKLRRQQEARLRWPGKKRR